MNTGRRRDAPASASGIPVPGLKLPGTWSSASSASKGSAPSSSIPTPRSSAAAAARKNTTSHSSGIPALSKQATTGSISNDPNKWKTSSFTFSQPAFTPRSRLPAPDGKPTSGGFKLASPSTRQPSSLPKQATSSEASAEQTSGSLNTSDVPVRSQYPTSDQQQDMMLTSSNITATAASTIMAKSCTQGLLDLASTDDDLLAGCKTPDITIKQRFISDEVAEQLQVARAASPELQATLKMPNMSSDISPSTGPTSITAVTQDLTSGAGLGCMNDNQGSETSAVIRTGSASSGPVAMGMARIGKAYALLVAVLLVWCITSTFLAAVDRKVLYMNPARFH